MSQDNDKYRLKKEPKRHDIHIPVLLQEVLHLAGPRHGQIIVDCTVGLGGYTQAFARWVGSRGKVIGIEADPRNARGAREVLADLSNVSVEEENFRNVDALVRGLTPLDVDSVIFDLGLSSPHVDDPQRGFSYQRDGPLDMRFTPSASTPSAADLLNRSTEKELALIFTNFGEEPRNRLIAGAIVKTRAMKLFVTTADLVTVITNVTASASRNQTVKRIFQALRIAVNDELEALKDGLSGAFSLLRPGGKLLVVAYHSLEGRITKDFFRSLTAPCVCPPELPVCGCNHPLARNLTPKAITPSLEERQANPRSRSARLRGIEKL